MPIQLTQNLIDKLKEKGVSTLLTSGSSLPDEAIFETPCSIKWMSIQHSIHLGAFSYGVSGFYFGCRIGRYCSFGEQVQIGRHSHPMHWFSTSPFFYLPFDNVLDQPLPKGIDLVPHQEFKRDTPPVTAKLTMIENDVWIGHGAFILPGVKIGTGSVIAAMSVVTKDIPPYSVVAGSPAKVIKYRFNESQINDLLETEWWEFAPWQLKGAHVDNIDEFIDFVKELRISNNDIYKPGIINLSDL